MTHSFIFYIGPKCGSTNMWFHWILLYIKKWDLILRIFSKIKPFFLIKLAFMCHMVPQEKELNVSIPVHWWIFVYPHHWQKQDPRHSAYTNSEPHTKCLPEALYLRHWSSNTYHHRTSSLCLERMPQLKHIVTRVSLMVIRVVWWLLE